VNRRGARAIECASCSYLLAGGELPKRRAPASAGRARASGGDRNYCLFSVFVLFSVGVGESEGSERWSGIVAAAAAGPVSQRSARGGGMASVQVASPPLSLSSSSQSQQFCLRWNNYQANLTSVFDQLLQSEVFVDVTLACDGHSVKAHKMVLSACSPYFQALFCDNPCKHPIVILKDVKWPELKAVVEFMYRGEINVLQEQIAPLLRVAETLRVRGLADVAASEPPPQQPSSSSSMEQHRPRKRARRHSGDNSSAPPTPPFELLESMAGVEPAVAAAVAASLASLAPADPPPQQQQQQMQQQQQPQQQQQQQQQSVVDDLEIKPGIAEMILEEERVSTMRTYKNCRLSWIFFLNLGSQKVTKMLSLKGLKF
jgi:BTB/POZ domain